MGGVTITELIDKMGLRNMTPELETDNVMLVHADVNRPALQLTGFFDHFDKDRVQIIGYVENAYISTLTPQRAEMFDNCCLRVYHVWYIAAAWHRRRKCWSCVTIMGFRAWYRRRRLRI